MPNETKEEQQLRLVEEQDFNNKKYLLGWAVERLGKAIGGRMAFYVNPDVSAASKYISEYNAAVQPSPELTEEEAGWSRELHTYMRKYWDEPLASVLYIFIDEDRATLIWYTFIKALIKYKFSYNQALKEVENIDTQNSDQRIFVNLLRIWGKKDFDKTIKDIREWNKKDE